MIGIKESLCELSDPSIVKYVEAPVNSYLNCAQWPIGVIHMTTSSNGKIFRVTWPYERGIHQSPVNSPHKGQWCGDLLFSLICVWTNGWVNNRDAGDLRHNHAHYDVTAMSNGKTMLKAAKTFPAMIVHRTVKVTTCLSIWPQTIVVITLTPYMLLPLFATRFADYTGGIRVSFIQPRLF